MATIHEQCAAYLKSRPADRIMRGLLMKYQSYGAIKGHFVLSKPTQDELDFLKGLFKKDFSMQKSVSISLIKFESAFQKTRYEGMALDQVLSIYFNMPLQSNQARTLALISTKRAFFNDITSLFKSVALSKWLSEAATSTAAPAYKFIHQLYSESDAQTRHLIFSLERLVLKCETSSELMPLPMAAAFATKDPHALDPGRPLRRLLLYYLSYIHKVDFPETLEATDALLESAHLMVESGMRTVLTYGLLAFDGRGEDLGWVSFYKRHEPLILTSMNVKREFALTAVSAVVRCFENPTPFYTSMFQEPDIAAVCTSGQVNALTYRLLDKLTAAGFALTYSGDFDPEGLLIADRLKKRYPQLQLSYFNLSRYHESLSQKVISDKRLKQLDKILDPSLQAIAHEMKIIKRAGYEEC